MNSTPHRVCGVSHVCSASHSALMCLACCLHGCALLPVCPVLAQGDLCRVWDGSQPVILQPKDEPYVFNSPVFRLASVERDGYPAFISQSEKVSLGGTRQGQGLSPRASHPNTPRRCRKLPSPCTGLCCCRLSSTASTTSSPCPPVKCAWCGMMERRASWARSWRRGA
jgi:hypothetical protein